MKRAGMLVLLLALLCLSARAQTLDEGINSVLGSMDLAALEEKSGQQDLRRLLLALAKGELVWDAGQVLSAVKELFLGEMTVGSRRMLGLLSPSMLCALAGILRGKNRAVAAMAENACFLALAAVMASDLKAYLLEAERAITHMNELMQLLFPLLLTLLAAVGSTAGAALFQPAIAAASGTMTTLVRSVSLPMAMGVAVISIVDGLSEKMRLRRLALLLRTCATWTLGISFTVFIGVTAMQGVTAGTADGVSIRAAKYAVDHFVPVVGGMFADTMDTLVGCSLLVKNALGVTGLAILMTAAGVPMIRTLCAALMYRLCAALLQPVAQERVGTTLQSFSDVLTLLFVIELSVSAMFLLLIAQMLTVGNATVTLR